MPDRVPVIIEETVAQGSQSVTARRICRIGSFKIRLTVKSDIYRHQCYAHAEVWSPEQMSWNTVHSIAPALMKTPEGLAYLPSRTGLDWSHFRLDLEALMKVAKEIVL